MFDRKLISQDITEIIDEHYFRAVDIYLFKPHVINRKLFGVNNVQSFTYRKHVDLDSFDTLSFLKDFQFLSSQGSSTEDIISRLSDKFRLNIRKNPDIRLKKIERNNQNYAGYIVLNRLLPRNLNVFKTLDVLAVIDIDSTSSSFICLQEEENNLTPKFPFTIQLNKETLSIKCNSQQTIDEKSSIWLKDILFQRLLKWIDNFVQESKMSKSNDEHVSLRLIDDLEEYNLLYSKLKTKYGAEMVKNWPETTDPKKFVYEDVAIATYLLLLWKQEREKNGCNRLQSFVDIGCGNGLLVYILTSEGHDGLGIDLRKRKIWDIYPQNVKLVVESIVPSENSLFPHADWLIGNHSDELSPWIPVLAARSAFRCRYFLLPCCAFEFDGSKFQRQNASISQYNGFLRYVNQISEVCGFDTAIDRLKIPSTKRTCLVGAGRIYKEEEFKEYCDKIQSFVNSRVGANRTNATNWAENFKPRENVEKVRNCTKIDRNIIDEIVRIVFEVLIAKKRIAIEFPGKNWNSGGTVALGELVKMIPADKLNSLKSECGGLQTLLKNNHQIFHVLNGCVQLRIPTKIGESSKTSVELKRKAKKQKNPRTVNLKERLCWFFCNHPDGCPFNEEDCKFKH